MEKLRCKLCGYEWYPRNPDLIPIPKECPKCKRMDWNKDKVIK